MKNNARRLGPLISILSILISSFSTFAKVERAVCFFNFYYYTPYPIAGYQRSRTEVNSASH